MSNQNFPSLNGIAPSWADIGVTATVDGGDLLDMIDIAAVKWTRKLDKGKQKGASGGRIIKRTSGEVSYDASMTLYRSGLRSLIKSLMKKGDTRGDQIIIGNVSFDVLIHHTPPGETEIYTTKIKGCFYTGDSDDMKEGNEADKIEVTLDPIEIVQIIDGKEVVLL